MNSISPRIDERGNTKWRKRSTSCSSTISTAREATESVSFGLDGTSYEIDLNDAERRRAARRALRLRRARPQGRLGPAPRPQDSSAAATTDGASAKEIRDWARSNGFDVPDRGRVSADVRQAFDAAH